MTRLIARAVAALKLPPHVDIAAFTREVEAIAAETPAAVKARQQRPLELARLCEQMARALPELPVLIHESIGCPNLAAALERQRADLELQVARQREQQKASRDHRHFALLTLAQRYGLDRGYDTPRRRKGRRREKPSGPGIDYLMTLSAAIGIGIEVDRAKAILARHRVSVVAIL